MNLKTLKRKIVNKIYNMIIYDLKKRILLKLKKKTNIKLNIKPIVSVIIPVYRTPLNYLKETLDSVLNQSYDYFEICISDGSGYDNDNNEITVCVMEYLSRDKRIIYNRLDKITGISANLNNAISLSNGEYITFLDHDDLLEKDSLMEFVIKINEDREVDFLYSDEDKTNIKGNKFFEPFYKPDIDISYLRNNNYICHQVMIKRDLMDKLKGFREEYDGAQDYDFVLRAYENAKKIIHIGKVLYNWRTHKDSTASNPESKMYAFKAGKKALEDHLVRCRIPVKVEMGNILGYYKMIPKLQINKRISLIIIGNKYPKLIDKKRFCEIKFIDKSNFFKLKQFIKNTKGDLFFVIDERIKYISDNYINEIIFSTNYERADIVIPRIKTRKGKVVSTGLKKTRSRCFRENKNIYENENGYFNSINVSHRVSGIDRYAFVIKKEIIMNNNIKLSTYDNMLKSINALDCVCIYNANIEVIL